jgi:hypothetical protein
MGTGTTMRAAKNFRIFQLVGDRLKQNRLLQRLSFPRMLR